jgi:hypothetical protein
VTIDDLRRVAAQKILILNHAAQQMTRQERMITPPEVRHVVETGEIIEDYPDDPRGHSCLVCGCGISGRVLHVVCAPKEEFLAIITAYLPSPHEWESDGRVRRRT